MSRFTPLVKKQYTFQGDNVTVTFSRLTRKHVIELMPLINSLKGGDKDAENETLNKIFDTVPKYVKDIKGLLDTDGNPIEVETIFSEMYFANLITEISLDVINESMPTEGADSKNV